MATPGKLKSPEVQKQVQVLASADISPSEIARTLNVHPSTICRYIEKIRPQLQEIRQYADLRADALTYQQGLASSLSVKLLESLHQDNLSAMSPEAKAKLLIPVAAQQDRAHQQERLERGLTTTNIALATVDLSEFKPIKE